VNNNKKVYKQKEILEAVDKCLDRISTPKDRGYFKLLLLELVKNKNIPIELLSSIPIPANKASKTRFDQLYDSVLSIIFPSYRSETLRRLLGPSAEIRKTTRIWRAIFPDKFKLSHVLLRADSFQQAFALACDYACRMSLRLYRRIPADLTVRVMFTSEKAICRKLDMRWANRVNKRHQLQLLGRDFSPKEIAGARLAALGKPSESEFRITKYAEIKDLNRIYDKCKQIRISEIESEVFKK
jgi:hypothetical protein